MSLIGRLIVYVLRNKSWWLPWFWFFFVQLKTALFNKVRYMGHWPCLRPSFMSVYGPPRRRGPYKHAETERGQDSAILTDQAWSIKDLLIWSIYEIIHNRTAVLNESEEEWSSQLFFNWTTGKKKPEKIRASKYTRGDHFNQCQRSNYNFVLSWSCLITTITFYHSSLSNDLLFNK